MAKRVVASFLIIICFILCSTSFAFYLRTFEKPVEFGKEFIGKEYSEVIHQFGKEPDVVEKLIVNKADKEFKNAFGSFIDSCNSNQQVVKFTYKNLLGDVTLWAHDNNNSMVIILAR